MKPDPEPDIPIAYLAICPWDVERWENSGAYLGMTLAAQGAYRNLCDKAWKKQPSCTLPDDDRLLWRLAGAGSLDEWLALKSEVFASDAWALTSGGWLNEVVLETYIEARRRHATAVRAGRVAGKASARARRALAQASQRTDATPDRTTVERSLNGRGTIVNPPSPSPSPSPSTDLTAPLPPKGGDVEQAGSGRRPRRRVAALHPALEKFATAFNKSFDRQIRGDATLNKGFLRREAEGHSADTLVALPILLAAQVAQGLDELKCGRAHLKASWLLRDGSGRYGGEDGGTRNTKDWIGSILGLADQTTIGPELLPLVDELGLRDVMQSLGVKRKRIAC